MNNRYTILALIFVLGTGLMACEVDQTSAGKTKAVEAATVEPDPSLVTGFQSLAQKAQNAIDRQQWTKATPLVARGLNQTKNAGRDYEVYWALFLVQKGILETEMGHQHEARRFLADAMAIFRLNPKADGAFGARLAMADLESKVGNFAAAGRELDEAQRLIKQDPDGQQANLLKFARGKLALNLLKYSDAAKLFLDCAKYFGAAKDHYRQAMSYLLLANAEESNGDWRQSMSSLRKAATIFEKADDQNGQVKALHLLAAAYLRQGKTATAKKILKQVMSLYLALGRQSDATKVSQHLSALPE